MNLSPVRSTFLISITILQIACYKAPEAHVAAALSVTPTSDELKYHESSFRRLLLAGILLSLMSTVAVLVGGRTRIDFHCWLLVFNVMAFLSLCLFTLSQLHYGYFDYIFIYVICIPACFEVVYLVFLPACVGVQVVAQSLTTIVQELRSARKKRKTT